MTRPLFLVVIATLHVIALSALARSATAQGQAALVRDLNTTVPSGNSNSNPRYILTIGNLTYFSAASDDSFREDRELWCTDMTSSGTRRVKNIAPGHASSNPAQFVDLGGVLMFTADDHGHGIELWRSDGTLSGTWMVKDINPGAESGYPFSLTVIGNTVYFSAYEPVTGGELWKSDGTPAGTVLVSDIVAGTASSAPYSFAALGNEVFFSADDQVFGRELWKSDGTMTGTSRVTNIHPTGDSSPSLLTVLGTDLLFVAEDGVRGRELWKTNGTQVGTMFVFNQAPGSPNNYYWDLRSAGANLYFNGNGRLYVTDGTTTQVIPTSTGVWPYDVLGTQVLFFSTVGTVSGLHVAGPPNFTPNLLKQLATGFYPPSLTAMGAVGPHMYLALDDRTNNGNELWCTDGTVVGTIRVKNIAAGAASSNAGGFAVRGTTVLFSAETAALGRELWRSNGTAAGTTLVKDLRIPTTSSFTQPDAVYSPPALWIEWMAKSELFHVSDNGIGGSELYKTNSTATGTSLILDIFPGTGSATPPYALGIVGGNLLFAANDNVNGYELWRTDGAAGGAGTWRVLDINIGPGGAFFEDEVLHSAVLHGNLLFVAWSGFGGDQLWKSDGTNPGTKFVTSKLNAGSMSYVTNVVRLGDVVLIATAGTLGTLWKTDGTAGGTVPLSSVARDAQYLTIVGDFAYFTAVHPTKGRDLWRTDGTPAGTVSISDIYPGPADAIRSNENPFLTPIGNVVYFAANDGVKGRELWKSDGTSIGTVRVHDIYPGIGSSSPKNLAALGSSLLFSATDLTCGREPWTSDGTQAGTVIVRDVRPGLDSSIERNFNPINYFDYGVETLGFLALPGSSRAVFAADDGSIGMELWTTDGSKIGTSFHQNINPGPASSHPSLPVLAGSNLYFTANDGTTGIELWAMRTLAAAIPYGDGCLGSNGLKPRIGSSGSPTIGTATFAVTLSDARANATTALNVGLTPLSLQLGPCTVLASIDVSIQTTTSNTGSASMTLIVPNNVAFLGVQLYSQWIVLDLGAAFLGLGNVSNGLKIVLG